MLSATLSCRLLVKRHSLHTFKHRRKLASMVADLSSTLGMQKTSLWSDVKSGNLPPYQIFNAPLEKSPNDDNAYRLIRLQNGLEALLVQDPKTDKAAASLDVAVGHLSDPDDMPGLAHFCEHLLFMGTKQFPKENDYSEFINSNGGSTNAFTASSDTNYHFSVATPHLRGALERFSAFFHSPLFEPSCTSRELNAVDSEHKKNRQQDGWRLFQLGKGLSTENHRWRKFGSGNKDSLMSVGRDVVKKQRIADSRSKPDRLATLASEDNGLLTPRGPSPAPSTSSEAEMDGGPAGREVRRRLLEWWAQEYCAGRMKLVVLGRESLDDLSALVTTLFSPVPNRGQEPLPSIEESPIGVEQMGTIVFAKTIMDMHLLEIAFPLPYQYPKFRSKPAGFLSHMIGHEGPGSIHAYLKNRGWLVNLEAGSSALGRGFDCFRVTMTLTPDGYKNWQEVLVIVYKYLSVFKASSLAAFHHDEIKAISETRFRFKEKRRPDDYATSLSGYLQRPYPRQQLLSASSLVWDFDPAEILEMLETFNVSNGRVMLMANSHDVVVSDGVWEKEKWYDTEYQVRRLDEDLVRRCSAENDVAELYLPGPNPFIPKDLSVEKTSVTEPSQFPVIIKETPLVTVWHKKDDQFWIPKAHMLVDIRTPVASVSPHHAVMSRLLCDLITDSLVEYSYDADLAGIRFSISEHQEGLQLMVGGYNDKLPVLLRKILTTMKDFRVDQSRLAVMQEQLELEYQNFKLSPPYRVADYWAKYLLQEKAWTREELLEALPNASKEGLELHLQDLLSPIYMEILVHGNMRKDEALRATAAVEDILGPQALAPQDRPTDHSLILPAASNSVWPKEVPNRSDVNSSLSYFCYIGDVANAKLRTALSLFNHIAYEPCFDQLRTKEQLGYIVSSSVWHSTGSMGWRIIIQSDRNPEYLEARAEAFLVDLERRLESMTDEDFASQRTGLIALKLEKYKNLGEEMSTFWNHIQSGYHDFTRRTNDASMLNEISKQDVIDLFMQHIHPQATERRKLSIHLKSQAPVPVKFTVEAAELFCSDLRSAGVEVDEEQFIKLSSQEPPLDAVVAHWSTVLSSNASLTDDLRRELLARLRECVVETSTTTVAEDVKPPAVAPTMIVDPIEFKSSLTISPAATPVRDYRDISLPRL